jgi:hypothetical protein
LGVRIPLVRPSMAVRVASAAAAVTSAGRVRGLHQAVELFTIATLL